VKHLPAELRRYAELVAGAQASITSVRDADELWSVHIEDALTALPVIEPLGVEELVDVGSGGGSPAIPLGVVLGIPVTMVESVGRKAAFLRETCAELGLRADVVPERAELFGRGPGRDRYPLATARALAPPVVAAELTLPLVCPGGHLVLWAGAVDRVAMETAAAELAAELVEERPTGERRRLLVLRKLAPTPERFPRRTGVAARRPLA
jgi:16S rRNA (guanine527-N7)-methyltransferase